MVVNALYTWCVSNLRLWSYCSTALSWIRSLHSSTLSRFWTVSTASLTFLASSALPSSALCLAYSFSSLALIALRAIYMLCVFVSISRRTRATWSVTATSTSLDDSSTPTFTGCPSAALPGPTSCTLSSCSPVRYDWSCGCGPESIALLTGPSMMLASPAPRHCSTCFLMSFALLFCPALLCRGKYGGYVSSGSSTTLDRFPRRLPAAPISTLNDIKSLKY